MSENPIWCGYLEAGSKSTPVVLDQRLNTGKPDTIYLFNQTRNTFLEYKREIVDAKLRELEEGETNVGALKAAFNEARKEFRPRTSRAQTIAERSTTAVKTAPDEPSEDSLVDEFVTVVDDPDSDAEEDEDEDEDDDWDEDDD
ncbi:hypothetical protein BI364_03255 [Acidihalobacter yilgarnensis]|uniref:Uncharacterized protein n=1 Tax=Acidihalobacter yilgarnensis TaxID=2819280 RepID=A0A1D8IL01_9GAMM|nr:hypothetical protein [Acidihalobacter yilgarnensis]AOU97150.1 hypothetical protein BI364_03255 [Acidihalobacter yilgarnensis]